MISRPRAFIVVLSLISCGVSRGVSAQSILAPTASESAAAAATTGGFGTLLLTVDENVDRNKQPVGNTLFNIDPQFQGVHYFSSARVQALFGKRERDYGWQLSGSSSLRYYPGLQRAFNAHQSILGSVNFPIGARLRIQGAGTFSYSPYYSLASALSPLGFDSSLAGADPVGTDPVGTDPVSDYSVARRTALLSATSLGIAYSLTQHSSLTVSAGTQRTDFVDGADLGLKTWNADAKYTLLFSKGLGMHLGYGRRVGDYALVTGRNRSEIDTVDTGLDFRHEFSFSRNTTLGFSSGMAVTTDLGYRQYGVTAVASLRHLIGRSALVLLQYNRGANLVDGLTRPVFFDTVSATLSGGFNRAVRFMARAGYSNGEVGTVSTSANDGYGMYYGLGNLQFPLTSWGSMHVDYRFYQHNLGSSVQLIGPVASTLQRQVISAGLTVRLPIFGRQTRGRTR